MPCERCEDGWHSIGLCRVVENHLPEQDKERGPKSLFGKPIDRADYDDDVCPCDDDYVVRTVWHRRLVGQRVGCVDQ